MDWQSANLAETFKLFKPRLELYFVVNKIKIEQLNYILLRVGNEGLKNKTHGYYQLEPKENFRINRLKLMTYKQEVEESLDDFVNRCRRMTQRCSLTEHEQQRRIIELIIASTPIADFQKELLRKDKTLTREETVSIGKSFQHSH